MKTFHYFKVESFFSKIDPKANLINSCLIGCAAATGYGSVNHIAQVHSGGSCAIWGLGAVGLSTVMACKEANAKRIIGIDTNPEKFALAAQLGCTELLNPNDSGIELINSSIYRMNSKLFYQQINRFLKYLKLTAGLITPLIVLEVRQ